MKKRTFLGILALLLIFVGVCWGAELMNIRTAGVDGNLVFYDASGNIICTYDATNRKVNFPSGSTLDIDSGGVLTFGSATLTAGTDTITTTAGTQTLTNKTLTSPTINGGTVAGATVTSPNVTYGVTATQHDYTAHEDWTLSTTEATYLLLVTSSGDGTDSNIVVYPTPSNGKLYVVRNGSVQNNIIKPSGGTGITIASGKTASVIFWGTDFIRVTADATH
jgi:hypothetical protein